MPPRKVDPQIPRDLETIVLKAIDKEPSRRYPSAEELAEDLRRFLEDRPIRARRVSSAERLLRWGRRNKLVAGLLASLVVTLVAGFVVSTSQWIRAEANAERAEANAEQLAQQLYTSDMSAIQQAGRPATSSRMGELLGRHIPGPARRTGAASSGTSSGGAIRGPTDPDAPAERRRLGTWRRPRTVRPWPSWSTITPIDKDPGHPLGCRDRLGAADVRGTAGDIRGRHRPLPGRERLRHGEPVRRAGT